MQPHGKGPRPTQTGAANTGATDTGANEHAKRGLGAQKGTRGHRSNAKSYCMLTETTQTGQGATQTMGQEPHRRGQGLTQMGPYRQGSQK
jgi:hypothetical protein